MSAGDKKVNSTALKSISGLLGESFDKCESMSLRLEKFVKIGGDTKKAEIDAVAGKGSGRIPGFKPKDALQFSAKLGGRLIVNQAGGILENAGLCIHPHYNAPYISGSAVKGCARHAAWQAWNEAVAGDAKIAAAREVAEIFGYPTSDDKLDEYLVRCCGYSKDKPCSGSVAFLPATPAGAAPLVTDIVNCHHAEYYSGSGKRPDATDDESPIPNFFPAVEKGADFLFTLVPRRCGDDMLKSAKKWVVKAIKEYGIGAKTAAGYGWFEYDEAAEEKRRKEAAKKAEEEKRRLEEQERKREVERIEAEKCARLAARSPLEKFFHGGAAAVCGKKGKHFEDEFNKASADLKDAVVKELQKPDGVGAEVWKMLRTDKNRKNQRAEDSVRKWCKDRKQGKMPQ